MKKPPRRATQLIYIQKDRLKFTSKIDQKKVNQLVKEFDAEKFTIPTGYLSGGKVTILQGNHRAKAMIKRDNDFIPFMLLTKQEFEWAKYTEKEPKIMTLVPDAPIYYPSYYIELKIGELVRNTSVFPMYAFPSLEDQDKIVNETVIPQLLKDSRFKKIYDQN